MPTKKETIEQVYFGPDGFGSLKEMFVLFSSYFRVMFELLSSFVRVIFELFSIYFRVTSSYFRIVITWLKLISL